ncbi:hypothetical protein VMCG_06338 [Cytospora schulzeri]|uniref:Rhodopsin domain-containing protein n=1 Tax=Cytospora schulzeri TaxID=448051 RepID=A0A423W8B3_9PEZI|nr:hypothetical protein VMCG_06338 [Valsa malicola]
MFPVERPQQRALILCAIIFSILPTIAVGLRLLARRMSNRKVDASDYMIIAACITVVAYQGLNISCILAAGGGYHVAELGTRFGLQAGPRMFIQMILAQQIIWAVSLGLSKLSILTLYSKVFSVDYFVIASRVTAVVIILWMLVVILGSILICQPVAFNWDQSLNGHCGNAVALWLSHGVLNIVTDLVVLLLPMPYMYSLEMALYKKLVLMVTFSLGLLVVIISAIRLYSLVHVDMADVTYTVPMPIMWSALEPCLAITLACVPLLRPLLGGRYSPTGTAKFGPPTKKVKSRTVTQKGSRQFNRLQDEPSITQLAEDDMDNIEVELGTVAPKNNVKVKEQEI